MNAGSMNTGVTGGVIDRFRSPSRWLLGVGPLALASLFLLRATTPAADPTLLGIFVVLLAGVAGLIAGSRIGAATVLLLSLALFQPMTAREFSFSLSAVDSDVADLGCGVTRRSRMEHRGGGRRVGAWRANRCRPGAPCRSAGCCRSRAGRVADRRVPGDLSQPAFGQDLDDDEITRLPVIQLLNFGYDPVVVEAPAGEPYRARLDNASDLPHTFTIEALDIEVFVPAGRWAIIELDPDALADAPLAVICTIGDHLAQGMASVIEIR